MGQVVRYQVAKPARNNNTLNRYNDWDIRLIDFINSVRKKPFSWGDHDCLTFANNAVIAQKGTGFDSGYLSGYDDVKGAIKAYNTFLEESGYTDIIDGLDQTFERVTGFPPRGSVVAMPVSDGAVFPYSFGIMVSKYAAFVSEEGLLMVVPDNTYLAWSIS